MHLRVSLQKFSNQLGFVCREVIGKHMHLFVHGLARHDVSQKGNDLLGGMAHYSLSEHFTGLDIEGCVER